MPDTNDGGGALKFDYNHLARVVRDFRTLAGLSQQDVAARGGPSDTTLSQIEAGRWRSANPGRTLTKLDRAYRWPEGSAMKALTKGFDPSDSLELAQAKAQFADVHDEWTSPRMVLSDLSDDQLVERVAFLSNEVHLAEARRAQVLADLQRADAALVGVQFELNRAAFEANRRQALPDPGANVLTVDELRVKLEHALVIREPVVGDSKVRPDILALMAGGELLVAELIRPIESVEDMENALWQLNHVVEVVEAASTHSIIGVLVEVKPNEVDFVKSLGVRPPEDTVLTREGRYVEAARDRPNSAPSRGQRRRQEADQAGEPVADDGSDMEPR